VIIPLETLAPDILQNIIKEFVLREGTDYGNVEQALSDKMVQIESQLKQGRLVIVYSELHETVNIMPADQFQEEH